MKKQLLLLTLIFGFNLCALPEGEAMSHEKGSSGDESPQSSTASPVAKKRVSFRPRFGKTGSKKRKPVGLLDSKSRSESAQASEADDNDYESSKQNTDSSKTVAEALKVDLKTLSKEFEPADENNLGAELNNLGRL